MKFCTGDTHEHLLIAGVVKIDSKELRNFPELLQGSKANQPMDMNFMVIKLKVYHRENKHFFPYLLKRETLSNNQAEYLCLCVTVQTISAYRLTARRCQRAALRDSKSLTYFPFHALCSVAGSLYTMFVR
jgi:hypothetical protein